MGGWVGGLRGEEEGGGGGKGLGAAYGQAVTDLLATGI